MRLIDADAPITRLNSVLETINVVFPNNFDVGCLAGVKLAIEMVKDAPSVDAVQVVRCKDCKYATYSERWKTLKCAEREYDFTPDDGYCFMGERGEADE